VNGRANGPPSRISVIVPSWRDAENLARLLPVLTGLDHALETIVVDASLDPCTKQLAVETHARLLQCSSPNRGEQMNLGASAATGDLFLFHHADAELTEEHLAAVEVAMRDPQIVGGAFYRKFDARHPRLLWLERMARFFTRHGGTLFGDQSVFVRREIFLSLGGFAKIPLMEDVEFSRRLRAAGKIAVVDPPIKSSSRRHMECGAWRSSLQNGVFIMLYKLGVSPQRLHRWYYRLRENLPATPEPSARINSLEQE
jgi:rSAM/selenodomain-associated transferase 2